MTEMSNCPSDFVVEDLIRRAELLPLLYAAMLRKYYWVLCQMMTLIAAPSRLSD